MSRLGKKPLEVPKGVTVSIQDNQVNVSGPKGKLDLCIEKKVDVKAEGNQVQLHLQEDGHNKFLGLYRALIKGMLKGVSEGYSKQLELSGIGYRAQVQGQKLSLTLGFSHPCEMEIPNGLEVKVDKSILIVVSGASSQLVGQFAAQIRSLRKPEPYKGKGIHYVGEYIRRKAGKSGKSAGKK